MVLVKPHVTPHSSKRGKGWRVKEGPKGSRTTHDFSSTVSPENPCVKLNRFLICKNCIIDDFYPSFSPDIPSKNRRVEEKDMQSFVDG